MWEGAPVNSVRVSSHCDSNNISILMLLTLPSQLGIETQLMTMSLPLSFVTGSLHVNTSIEDQWYPFLKGKNYLASFAFCRRQCERALSVESFKK